MALEQPGILCVYTQMCITLFNMSFAELVALKGRRAVIGGRLAMAEETNDGAGWS